MNHPFIMQIPSASQRTQFAVPPSSNDASMREDSVAQRAPESLPLAENDEMQPAQPRVGDALSLQQIERAHIRGVLARSSSLDAAAKTLGIDVSTLYRKRKLYGLQ